MNFKLMSDTSLAAISGGYRTTLSRHRGGEKHQVLLGVTGFREDIYGGQAD